MTPHPYQLVRWWLSSPSAQQVFPPLVDGWAEGGAGVPGTKELAEPSQAAPSTVPTPPSSVVVLRFGDLDFLLGAGALTPAPQSTSATSP
jgi:hypothetical protein